MTPQQKNLIIYLYIYQKKIKIKIKKNKILQQQKKIDNKKSK
jgi:hypothetical protein